MLKKVESYVNKKFAEKNLSHFKRTVYWVKHLKPEADEAMLIAAYAHDIERPFNIAKRNSKRFESGKTLEAHQIEGGKIIHDFLLKNGADEKLANRVKELVEKHEKGGTKDQNIIKDADSISYFENNTTKHAKLTKKGFTKKEIRKKFDWMFNRISSNKARKISEPLYKKAIEILESN
jgi:hypothetical protein